MQGIGSGFNGTGITFPNDLDEYDLTQRDPIDIDMVELYDPISDVQIPQTTFLQALLEVAEAILTVRQELGKSSKEWEEQMKKAISDLRARLG